MVLKQWVHGELKAPVAMAGGGGVLGERGGEKAKIMKGLACGGICRAAVREREER